MSKERSPGLSDLPPGSHVCWEYETPPEFRFGLAGFVREGLARGERVVCYLASDRYDEACSSLRHDVPEARAALGDGALLVLSARSTYLSRDGFDPQVRLTDVVELTARSLADGYAALRTLLQASDFKNSASAVRAWPGCELRSDFLVAGGSTTLVCAYDASMCHSRTIDVLRAVHPRGAGRSVLGPSFGLHAGRDGELSLHGEIDISVTEVVDALGSVAANEAAVGILDVSRLRFADVSGMRALRNVLRVMTARHGHVQVYGATPTFQRVWQLLELDRDLEMSFVPLTRTALGARTQAR